METLGWTTRQLVVFFAIEFVLAGLITLLDVVIGGALFLVGVMMIAALWVLDNKPEWAPSFVHKFVSKASRTSHVGGSTQKNGNRLAASRVVQEKSIGGDGRAFGVVNWLTQDMKQTSYHGLAPKVQKARRIYDSLGDLSRLLSVDLSEQLHRLSGIHANFYDRLSGRFSPRIQAGLPAFKIELNDINIAITNIGSSITHIGEVRYPERSQFFFHHPAGIAISNFRGKLHKYQKTLSAIPDNASRELLDQFQPERDQFDKDVVEFRTEMVAQIEEINAERRAIENADDI